MSKKYKIGAVVLLAISAVMFSACGEKEPDMAPNDVVDQAIENIREYKAMAYDFAIVGTSKMAKDSITWEFDIDGAVDFSDTEKPLFTLALKGEANNDLDKKTADGELRMEAMKVYFMIRDLSDIANLLSPEMAADFMGKWWSLDLPDEIYSKFKALAEDSEDTEEKEALKALAENTEFLKDVKYSDSKNGLYRYNATLDQEAWKVYLVEAMKIRGEELTEDTNLKIDTIIGLIDPEIVIGVTKSEMILAEISGKIMEEENTNLDFKLSLSDFGKSVVIEIPEDVSDLSSLTQ